MTSSAETAAIALLRRPETIRGRCGSLLALAAEDRLAHFALRAERLDAAADYVVDTIRARHPDLAVPYHARWRHFAAGGRDRWGELAATLRGLGSGEVARLRVELCVVSVLLDAGAGAAWSYTEPATGAVRRRSEGLAVASLDAFRAGLFSGDPVRHPLRADADGLSRLDAEALGRAFQAGPGSPLEGLERRAALMRNLGAALRDRPDLFGAEPPRIGGLYDDLLGQATAEGLPARAVLAAVLDGLGPIWPGRLTLGGIGLGDVWRHPMAAPDGPAPGLVPFHKLSQWLAYSLVEEQQRVALARALVTSPSVLLLDEPLSALDPFLRGRVRAELKRLNRELGITFVHVTHAQDEALAPADSVVLMRAGPIEQQGTPEELFDRPRTAFVARFMGGHNVVAGPGGTVAVRSDRTRLAPLAAPGAVEAVVRAVEYTGTGFALTLAGAGTDDLTVLLDEAEHRARPAAPGDRVGLTWSDAGARPLAADQ